MPINRIITASLGSSRADVTCSRMGSPGAGAEVESGAKMNGKERKQDWTEGEVQLQCSPMKPGLASSPRSFGECPPVRLVLLSAPRDRPTRLAQSLDTGAPARAWPQLSGSVAGTDPKKLTAGVVPLPQQTLLY